MPDLTPAAPSSGVSLSTLSSGQVGGQTLSSLGNAQIVKLPDKLQTLSRSVVIGAQVTSQNPDGSGNLKTAVGDMVVKPTPPLPPGQQTVTLQIAPGTPPATAALYTATTNASGQPQAINPNMPNLAATLIAIDTKTLPIPNAAVPAAPQLLKEGAIITALVLPEAEEEAQVTQSSTASSQQPKTEGEEIASGLAGKMIPRGAAGTASLSPRILETVQQTMNLMEQQNAGKTPNLAQHVFSQTGSFVPPTVGMQQLPPGSHIALQVLQLGEQVATPTAATANSAASGETPAQGPLTLEGKIIALITPNQSAQPAQAATQANNQMIVETPLGRLLISANTTLPEGSKITLQWVQATNAAKSAAQIPLTPLNAFQGKDWPALQTLLQSLIEQGSIAAPHLLNTMPKFNGDLPTSALFFLTALRSGNAKHWLGEGGLGEYAEEALDATGQGKAAEMLSKDFASLKGLKLETQNGEWKLYPMPFLGDQGLNRMQLAVRDHYELPEGAEENGLSPVRVTRFLVDVDFSAFGTVQLDGFMKEKKLDVIVRSPTLLPQEMRRELTGIYNDTLESQGMNGTVIFQAGFQNWVKLMQKENSSSYSA